MSINVAQLKWIDNYLAVLRLRLAPQTIANCMPAELKEPLYLGVAKGLGLTNFIAAYDSIPVETVVRPETNISVNYGQKLVELWRKTDLGYTDILKAALPEYEQFIDDEKSKIELKSFRKDGSILTISRGYLAASETGRRESLVVFAEFDKKFADRLEHLDKRAQTGGVENLIRDILKYYITVQEEQFAGNSLQRIDADGGSAPLRLTIPPTGPAKPAFDRSQPA